MVRLRQNDRCSTISRNGARRSAESFRDFSDATIMRRCILRERICLRVAATDCASESTTIGDGPEGSAELVNVWICCREGPRAPPWVEVRRPMTVTSEGSERRDEVAIGCGWKCGRLEVGCSLWRGKV